MQWFVTYTTNKGTPALVFLAAGKMDDHVVTIALFDKISFSAKPPAADNGNEGDRVRQRPKEKEPRVRTSLSVEEYWQGAHSERRGKYEQRQEIERMLEEIDECGDIAVLYDKCHDPFMGSSVP